MKKLSFYIVSFLLLFQSARAQPTYSSQFVDEPERLIDFVVDCADFWSALEDGSFGGFYTSVGRSGNILSTSNKGIVSTSRDAYGFARAFMLTGDEAYLDKGRSALEFMYAYLWDDDFGGWYNRTNRSGSGPFTGDKEAFDQHYALLGITAMYEATRNANDWSMLMNGYDFIEDFLWDDDPEEFGYYHQIERDGSDPRDKSFNSTVDAITTHLYTLYLLTMDDTYYDRLIQVKRNMIDHLIGSMEDQVIGFAEHFNTDWSINESDDRTIIGHVLKTGWSLARIYRLNTDEECFDNAEIVVQEVLDKAYDHEYGGPYKDYLRKTGEMLMYGAYDTAKAWWQMEQAITAGFLLFEITWEQEYLKMADETLDFYMKYFVDPIYGEVYADRAREGGRVYYGGGYWDENKGSDWKAAYHSIETGYYSYLYSQLLIKQEAATLYYKYGSEPAERTLTYNPLAVDLTKLKIESVTLNGETYTDFDRDLRTVTMPAGTEGVFAISYIMEGLGVVIPNVVSGIAMNTFDVEVYPNPAFDILKIDLPKMTNTKISITDTGGRQVKYLQANNSQIEVDVRDMIPGMYVLHISTDNETASHLLMIGR